MGGEIKKNYKAEPPNVNVDKCRRLFYVLQALMEKEKQRQKDKEMKKSSGGYHSKIYMQVDGKTCLFEIIIGHYFHTMLLDANACKKRTPKAETRG